MPENDFEKQVQQKMDELRFVPSETVWPEVEKEIREKKKRRVIFWIPLFALLLGGSAWLYYGKTSNNVKEKNSSAQVPSPSLVKVDKKDTETENTSEQSTDATAKKKNENIESPATNDVTLRETKKDNSAIVSDIKKAATNTPGKKIETSTNNKSTLSNAEKLTAENAAVIKRNRKIDLSKNTLQPLYAKNKQQKKMKSDKHALGAKEEISFSNNQNKFIKKSENKIGVADGTSTEKNSIDIETARITTAKDANKSNIIDSSSALVANVETATNKAEPDSVHKKMKTDSVVVVAKNKTVDPSKKKLNWGIHVQSGMSAVSSGFTSFFSSTPSYDVNSFSGNLSTAPSTGVGNGNNAGSTARSAPAEIKPGFSFGVGGVVGKPLEKNWSVLIGFQYNYMSTHIMTGNKNTASATQVQYNTGSTQNYTNSFHFIELPVSLQKQFSQKSRFSAEGGLVFSWLLATNAVLYSSQSGNFIKDNSLVNKFQVGMRVGVNYTLFPGSLPIQVGPYFYYGASNIFDKQSYGSKHLMNAGVQANIFLHKKKH